MRVRPLAGELRGEWAAWWACPGAPTYRRRDRWSVESHEPHLLLSRPHRSAQRLSASLCRGPGNEREGVAVGPRCPHAVAPRVLRALRRACAAQRGLGLARHRRRQRHRDAHLWHWQQGHEPGAGRACTRTPLCPSRLLALVLSSALAPATLASHGAPAANAPTLASFRSLHPRLRPAACENVHPRSRLVRRLV